MVAVEYFRGSGLFWNLECSLTIHESPYYAPPIQKNVAFSQLKLFSLAEILQ